ncbi:MAG: archease [Chloroflexi bacterium]|nr:archease [Chloroflexota bacterium]
MDSPGNSFPAYEIVDHTADVGIRAYGHDLREAFANTAYGMVSLMIDPEKIQERIRRDIEVRGDDLESLLVAWLTELLYYVDSERLLFKRFDIHHLDGACLKATVYGERIDLRRHRFKTAVKAATYHLLRVENGDPCLVQVILDV